MFETLAPILFAVLAWWASTGALIWLVGRGEGIRRAAAITLTMFAIGATIAVAGLRDEVTIAGAYAGFATGIVLWAWHEAMLLFGFISGPRRSPCPPDLHGWQRFRISAQAVLHHEAGIVLHAALIIWLSAGASNQVAAATFILLWVMRISAKLLIFLGAANASDEFLPKHLKYLSTYFNTARTTRYFPIFLGLASAVAVALLYRGITHHITGSFEAAGYLLVGTLALLAAFEHLALVVRLPDQRLWSWAVRKNADAKTEQQNETLEYGRT